MGAAGQTYQKVANTYATELRMKKDESKSLEWVTTLELTEELRNRFPGAGIVCCEELAKTNDEASSSSSSFEIEWGSLHRVAGLIFGLRTMVEHTYFKMRAIRDMEQETDNGSEPDDITP